MALAALLAIAWPVTGIGSDHQNVAASTGCPSGREALFWEHEFEDGDSLHWCYPQSFSSLSALGWNDRIDSFHSYNPAGIGFLLYKEANFAGASWKICGSTIRDEMLTGWHDAVSSIKPTTQCPQ